MFPTYNLQNFQNSQNNVSPYTSLFYHITLTPTNSTSSINDSYSDNSENLIPHKIFSDNFLCLQSLLNNLQNYKNHQNLYLYHKRVKVLIDQIQLKLNTPTHNKTATKCHYCQLSFNKITKHNPGCTTCKQTYEILRILSELSEV
jgi:hypothetical protein